MIQEPFVKVTTIDYTNADSMIPDQLVCGMVINSDCGPVGKTRVNTQAEFIDKYLLGNQLTTTDHTTVIHAMKLLQFMPIYVTRAMDNSILGGITSNNEIIYTDLNYNVMTHYKKIKFKKNSVVFDNIFIGFASGDNSFCFYEGTSPAGNTKLNYLNYIQISATVNSLDDLIKNLNKNLTINQLDSILSIEQRNGKYYLILNNNTQLIEVGYSKEGTYYQLDVASNFCTNKYLEFSFNLNDNTKFESGQYFSINGFTYYPNQLINNNLYPYIGVPISYYGSENLTAKLLAYMTDDQYINSRSIKPSILYQDANVIITFDSAVDPTSIKIDISDSLNITYDLLSNGSYRFYEYTGSTFIEDGYITIKYLLNGVTYANILYKGTRPVVYDDDGNVIPDANINYLGSDTSDKFDLNTGAKFLIRLGEVAPKYLSITGTTSPYSLVDTDNTNYTIRSTDVGSTLSSLSFTLVNGDIIRYNGEPSETPSDPIYKKIHICYPLTTYSGEDPYIYRFSSKFGDDKVLDTLMESLTIDNIIYDTGTSKYYKIIDEEGNLEEYTPESSETVNYTYRTELTDTARINSLNITLQVGNIISDGIATYTIGDIINRLDDTESINYNYMTNTDVPVSGTLDSLSVNVSVGSIIQSIPSGINYVPVTTQSGRASLLYPANDYLSSDISKISSAPINAIGPDTPSTLKEYSFVSNIEDDTTYQVQVRIGDYLFYNVGYNNTDPDITPIRISTKELTFVQLVRTLRKSVGDYFKLIYSDDGFTLMTDDSRTIETIEITGIGYDDIVETNAEGIIDSAKFAIINKCPSKKAYLKYTLIQDEDDPEIYKLTIYRTTKDSFIDYNISFVSNKVDGYGNSIYYTYVNEINDFIHIIELSGSDQNKVTSKLFGNEVPVIEPESDDFASAVYRYKEDYGTVYYDFIFDGGYANTQFAKAIFDTCKEIYAEGVISPMDTFDYTQLIRYRDELGISGDDGWRCILRGKWIKDTTVADFMTLISPGAAWIETIYNNKDSGKEFAPCFGAANSTIGYIIKDPNWNKDAREKLLNNQIPVILDDKSLGLRYFNLDTTLKSKDSYLACANNARMVNIGAHICDNQCKWYIGRFNNKATRLEVTNTLTRLLTQRLISNQTYAPIEIKVVCNETNNPNSVIRNRQLIVDVYYKFESEIRYVLVYQKVVDLDTDLTTIGTSYE